MLEVEQKFAVTDKEILIDQLDHLGATRGVCLEQSDHYFTHPVRNFAETDEAIRIRCNGSDNRITYKGPKRNTVSKVRKEIELAFESGKYATDQMTEILEILGFQLLKTVKKLRTPFNYLHNQRSFEITVDEVEGLGTFVELELMATEAELPNAETAVIQLAESLGLSNSIRGSYLGLLIESENQSGST